MVAYSGNDLGGGVYVAASTVIVVASDISPNQARGGLFVDPTTTALPVLHNTLIAGNFRGATGTTPDDVSGYLDPGGDYNLIGDGTGMTGLSNGVNGNQVGSASAPIDPLLGPLMSFDNQVR